MEFLDWGVVGLYFGLLFAVVWWVVRQNRDTADDYFLAGRNLGWFIVGASIFASNIGSEHLVGLAGSGCTDGVAMAHYELHAWCLLVSGLGTGAVLHAIARVHHARVLWSVASVRLTERCYPSFRLVAYVVTKIAVGIFAGGIVFSVLLPEMKIGPLDSFWIGSILVIVLTGAYTVSGGAASGRLYRGPANDHPGCGFRAGHDLRLEGARWLGRAARDLWLRVFQSLEAARPRWD